MQILLNGKVYELESSTILALLEKLDITHKAMAIAVNTQVLKKEKWSEYILQMVMKWRY